MVSISPFLWFDDEAEEAATFYVSLFPNSTLGDISRAPSGVPDVRPGAAFLVSFTLDGIPVQALNAGPQFPHTEAFSFFVEVDSQEEIDRYWDALIENGGQPSQCGWLKDRWGLSWQIVPRQLGQLQSSPDRARANAAMQAMFGMQRLVIADLQAAFDAA
ncbi:VOC family protein [Naasia lichenicola]|uniref:VOC family protein n=1 Tax=Naasia lichenicola TaxID=2565933 RepID=A0A4S4FSA9_9MICO|nr:VOC family protein [Naasia lichenicola]THG33178.1 VOC family protein [Naasia lichenicola]